MCDLSDITTQLVIASAAITAALGFIAAAIALNGGFFSAPGATVPMGLAAASSAAAAMALSSALQVLEACDVPTQCAGELENLRNALSALSTVLGLQATAAALAIIPAAVPYLGAAPMATIAATLTVQVGLIPSAIAFVQILGECIEEASQVTVTLPIIYPAVITLIVVTGLVATTLLTVRFSKKQSKET